MGAEFERLEIGFWVQTVMQEIKIKLWRNDQAQDWSIEINGLLAGEDKLDNLHYSLKRNE
jgi:hypothetical protein